MDIFVTHIWSVKAFKGTFINQALPSFHGGSIEITLTDPLNQWKLSKDWRQNSKVPKSYIKSHANFLINSLYMVVRIKRLGKNA